MSESFGCGLIQIQHSSGPAWQRPAGLGLDCLLFPCFMFFPCTASLTFPLLGAVIAVVAVGVADVVIVVAAMLAAAAAAGAAEVAELIVEFGK